MALKDDILAHVKRFPDRTATQIANDLKQNPSSVSSLLNRLANKGVLERKSGGGPRGGYSYRFPRPKGRPSNKTAWQHLQDEDGL